MILSETLKVRFAELISNSLREYGIPREKIPTVIGHDHQRTCQPISTGMLDTDQPISTGMLERTNFLI